MQGGPALSTGSYPMLRHIATSMSCAAAVNIAKLGACPQPTAWHLQSEVDPDPAPLPSIQLQNTFMSCSLPRPCACKRQAAYGTGWLREDALSLERQATLHSGTQPSTSCTCTHALWSTSQPSVCREGQQAAHPAISQLGCMQGRLDRHHDDRRRLNRWRLISDTKGVHHNAAAHAALCGGRSTEASMLPELTPLAAVPGMRTNRCALCSRAAKLACKT